MARALRVTIIANIGGKKVPWNELPEEKKREISTKLHSDAMQTAGYEKSPEKRQLHQGNM